MRLFLPLDISETKQKILSVLFVSTSLLGIYVPSSHAQNSDIETLDTVSATAPPVSKAQTQADATPSESDGDVMPVVGYEGCEIVLIENLAKGTILASYRPADQFIESIYDDEEGVLTTVDGLDVLAVMCTRPQVVPRLRDFPIIASGVQFSLSTDFESAESQFMTVYFKDGRFRNKFVGPPLTQVEDSAVRDVMEIYNLQKHNLGLGKTQ